MVIAVHEALFYIGVAALVVAVVFLVLAGHTFFHENIPAVRDDLAGRRRFQAQMASRTRRQWTGGRREARGDARAPDVVDGADDRAGVADRRTGGLDSTSCDPTDGAVRDGGPTSIDLRPAEMDASDWQTSGGVAALEGDDRDGSGTGDGTGSVSETVVASKADTFLPIRALSEDAAATTLGKSAGNDAPTVPAAGRGDECDRSGPQS